AATTRTVFDDDLLTKHLAELLAQDACRDVDAASGEKRHDQPDRSVRIVLSLGLPNRLGPAERQGRQHQSRNRLSHGYLASRSRGRHTVSTMCVSVEQFVVMAALPVVQVPGLKTCRLGAGNPPGNQTLRVVSAGKIQVTEHAAELACDIEAADRF